MENRMFSGSLCLTEIVEKAKAGHSAFTRAANGKVYFNIIEWINSEPDKFGNTVSVQLSSKADKRDAEGKVYIGNLKPFEKQEPTPVASAEVPAIDDLPF